MTRSIAGRVFAILATAFLLAACGTVQTTSTGDVGMVDGIQVQQLSVYTWPTSAECKSPAALGSQKDIDGWIMMVLIERHAVTVHCEESGEKRRVKLKPEVYDTYRTERRMMAMVSGLMLGGPLGAAGGFAATIDDKQDHRYTPMVHVVVDAPQDEHDKILDRAVENWAEYIDAARYLCFAEGRDHMACDIDFLDELMERDIASLKEQLAALEKQQVASKQAVPKQVVSLGSNTP